MYDRIILLTKCFPFDIENAPAENYLANEMIELSKHTSHLDIYAFDADVDAKISVVLPDNVTAVCMSDKKAFRKLKIFYAMIREFLITSEEAKFEKKNNSWKRNLYLMYFLGKSDYYTNCFYRKSKTGSSESKILIYTFWFHTYTRTALKIKENFVNARVITRAHRYDLYSDRNRIGYLPIRKYLLEKVDYVFPCSEHGREYLRHSYPEFEEKIETAYLGSRNCGLNKIEKHADFRIVSCSRVVAIKRVYLILEALCLIEKRGFPVKITWTHIGDGEQLYALKEKVRDLKKTDQIHLDGWMSNDRIMQLYQGRAFDLFVNVSESEGLPLSIMEAASFGLPILASDVGGTREIVDEENGWLISADIDAEELADKIMEIARLTEEELKIKRQASRKKWCEMFNISRNTSKMLERICDE